MKAVAYYRTRPSEPEASETALRLQREAVRQELDEGKLTLVAEFIEREGESDPETYPTFTTAVQAASNHSSGEGFIDVAFLVASTAAIGTGTPFAQPHVPGGHNLFWFFLQSPTVPIPAEITLPDGAPGPLCLLGIVRLHQRDTLVYLCNSGQEPLRDVTLVLTMTDMNTFFTAKDNDRWADGRTGKEHWEVVPAGVCVQVSRLDHEMWDFVRRYQLTFRNAAGRSWAAEAHDCDLSICDMPRSERAWVEFSRPALAVTASSAGPERS